jgi:hypothetical protein
MIIAEADRFPAGAAQYFDVIFSEPHARLSVYLQATFGLSADASAEAAQDLLARVIHPRFARALFGVDETVYEMDDEAIRTDFDLKPVRKAVAEMIESLALSQSVSQMLPDLPAIPIM